jgi:hypothetical protein
MATGGDDKETVEILKLKLLIEQEKTKQVQEVERAKRMKITQPRAIIPTVGNGDLYGLKRL